MPTILRPMSTGELLDRTFTLYRKHFLLFVGIVALPNLAHLAVQLGVIVFNPAVAPGRFDWSRVASQFLWGAASLGVYLLALAASQAATVVAVSGVHLDKPVSVTASFEAIKRRIPQLLWIMVAVGIGIFVGFLLLIVPAILLTLRWSLTIPVAVLENAGFRVATRRSAELTKGNRGRIFLVYLLFGVLMYAISAIWEVPLFAFVVSTLRSGHLTALPAWFRIYAASGSFLTQCLVGPLVTIATALIYYDERVRKEGFDLQYMISNLETQPQAGLTVANPGQ
jgi:hypothetical protein